MRSLGICEAFTGLKLLMPLNDGEAAKMSMESAVITRQAISGCSGASQHCPAGHCLSDTSVSILAFLCAALCFFDM